MYTTVIIYKHFIRIRSPKRAPPVFSLRATDIKRLFSVGKNQLIKNDGPIQSTKLDFPEPPVPVIPKTGTACSLF